MCIWICISASVNVCVYVSVRIKVFRLVYQDPKAPRGNLFAEGQNIGYNVVLR